MASRRSLIAAKREGGADRWTLTQPRQHAVTRTELLVEPSRSSQGLR
jgi:hypothetical protein